MSDHTSARRWSPLMILAAIILGLVAAFLLLPLFFAVGAYLVG